MRHRRRSAAARIATVMALIAATFVMPEPAQLFLVAGLAMLCAADLGWERRELRRGALATAGYPPGRHREARARNGLPVR